MSNPLFELYARTLYGRHQRFTPQSGWRPLYNDEWSVLALHLLRLDPTGRPVANPRSRLDAIFWLAAQPATTRWADLPEWAGKPDTVHRQFRRWAKAGLFTQLLKDLADRDAIGHETLARIASWICRAYRRAWRILGLAGIALAKRLGFLSALRGPPWWLPDPTLSEDTIRRFGRHLERADRRADITRQPWYRATIRLLKAAHGRSIPRILAWP